MSDAIKPGDLVMIVRGTLCCGETKAIGRVYVAGQHYHGPSHCPVCETISMDASVWLGDNPRVCALSRLKKIDPPSEGDSLPTRADLDIKVPA